MSNASALAERMRKHVRDRGGLAKDDDGKPVIPNGAWAMMIEAADVIESLEGLSATYAETIDNMVRERAA